MRASKIFARKLDHHTTIDRLSHDAIAFLPGAEAPGATTPEGGFRRLFLAAYRGHLGGKVGFLPLDSLAESIAHKSGNLHRCADLALSFLHRLGDRFGVIVDESLLQQ